MTVMTRAFVLAAALAAAHVGTAMPGPQRPCLATDQQMKALISRIDTDRDQFRASFARASDRGPVENLLSEQPIDRSLTAFEQAVDLLRDCLDSWRSNRADAETLLRRASAIDDYMARNRLDGSARGDWQALRLDLDALSCAYGFTWDWTTASPAVPVQTGGRQAEAARLP